MQLISIQLHNFRRYENAKFFVHPKFTVLIGDNGKGKTTILDAIAIMLGTYFQGSGIVTGQSVVGKNNARLVKRQKGDQVFLEAQKEVFIDAMGVIHDKALHWRREVGDRGGKARNIVEIGADDRGQIAKGVDVDLPVLLYYGSGRLWDIHRDIDTEAPESQLGAYRFCLDPKSDQKAFEKWFKRITLSAIQRKSPSLAIDVVRKAVLTCIPDAVDFYFDIEQDQIIIELDENEVVPFNNLSDGYRNMVAMVADIAHRTSKLNPHFKTEAAGKTKGVVLIDEIDLHLHPRWQRRVVRDLKTAFPQLQFIATTHSPFIIQSLNPGEVIDLNDLSGFALYDQDDHNVAAPGPAGSYAGRSIEDIVEEIMGVAVPQRSHRYQEMFDAAKEYYRTLQMAGDADEQTKEELKRKLDELSAPFSDNIAYHAFLEMERMAAGVGGSNRESE